MSAMHEHLCEVGESLILEPNGLEVLIQRLRSQGFRVVGPRLLEGVIGYGELESTADLPQGWTDEQEAGRYRLQRRPDGAWFGYNVGPQSWKRYLLPPLQRLWQARRSGRGWEMTAVEDPVPPTAFLGVRACELAAIEVQDRVFLGSAYADPAYRLRRQAVWIIAVQCTQAGGTCFCVSLNTGPHVRFGYDLSLTELIANGEHRFVGTIGSERAACLMRQVPHQCASDEDLRCAQQAVEWAAEHMGRRLDTTGIRELLYSNYEHPRWQEVGARCLSCGNCTMVCPTCFCTTVQDSSDLAGDVAERVRRWDSCFSMDFSYMRGGNARPSTPARYRHWLVHKLATWMDQFGTSGCVGCGRCLTWCPVGIDITEEVAAMRCSPHRQGRSGGQRATARAS